MAVNVNHLPLRPRGAGTNAPAGGGAIINIGS
jgi:hypothetical protein